VATLENNDTKQKGKMTLPAAQREFKHKDTSVWWRGGDASQMIDVAHVRRAQRSKRKEESILRREKPHEKFGQKYPSYRNWTENGPFIGKKEAGERSKIDHGA